jgi:small subunit ribosomal protein S20
LAERHKSAIKRHRQSLKKAARNRAVRTQMRHTIRELREVIGRAETETAAKMLPAVIKTIDKAATKGVIHRNNASRRISRLSHQVAQLGKAS